MTLRLHYSITPLLLLVLAASAVRTHAQESPPPAIGGGGSERFKQLDRDGDGKLSAQEVKALASLSRLFAQLDTDRDGGVSAPEIRAVVARFPGLAVLVEGAPQPAPAAPDTSTADPLARELAQQFQKLDTNRDGIISPDEAGDSKWFDRMDRNRDGGVTPYEMRTVSREKAGRKHPKSAATPSLFTRLTYKRDFEPGTDPNGKYMGGTSTMYLVEHREMLWAGIGVMAYDPGANPHTGPQILYKPKSDSSWQVDTSFGPEYRRVDALIEAQFTTDRHGVKLDPPVTRLVAACMDIKAPFHAVVWTRDPDSTPGHGVWNKAHLPGLVRTDIDPRQGVTMEADYNAIYVRILFDAVDTVTGVHNIYAGVQKHRGRNGAELRRGAWHSQKGEIVWDDAPEIEGPPRIMSSVVFDGRLYVVVGSDNNPANTNGGLFRRIDGPEPRWEFIYEWPVDKPKPAPEGRDMRGLTVVPRPDGKDGEMLIATVENQQTFVQIDPAADHAVSVEVDAQEYFDTLWHPGTRFRYAAYNNIVQAYDPLLKEPVWLIGALIFDTRPPADAFWTQSDNLNAWMLIRHKDGSYDHTLIVDPAHPLPASPGLAGVRTIVASPFPDEQGRVWYFGGCDGTGKNLKTRGAWIYKGSLPEVKP